MQPERSDSFPSYIDGARPSGRDALRIRRVARLVLVGWAAAVYLVYWLGQLGWR